MKHKELYSSSIKTLSDSLSSVLDAAGLASFIPTHRQDDTH